ncbi:hypothetical protein CR513_26492, partial [Mucuna pruriens]
MFPCLTMPTVLSMSSWTPSSSPNDNVMVINVTKVSFVLLVTLVVIIPCLKTNIGEFENFLKVQTKEAYKIALNAYVLTLE